MDTRIEWSIPFANDGGPLIVLPRELLRFWKGGEGPPVSEEFPFGAYYARACAAPYPAALVEVGPGVGLVLGSEDIVFPAHWLRVPELDLMLVGWEYGDEDAEAMLVECLLAENLAWSRLPQPMRVAHGDLLLLHAGSRGGEVRELETMGNRYAVIGDAIPIHLEPGEYAIEVVVVGGNLDRDPLGCVVCRWLPVNPPRDPLPAG
jgi:hypothetical protein